MVAEVVQLNFFSDCKFGARVLRVLRVLKEFLRVLNSGFTCGLPVRGFRLIFSAGF